MKNKKLAYILLPVVLLIWGAVIWQLVDKPAVDMPMGNTTTFESEEVPELNDTIKLVLNYEDPFLKKRPKHRIRNSQSNNGSRNNARKKVSRIQKKPVLAARIQWPTISYSGKINTGVLVSINKRAHVIKQGEEISGVSFIKIFDDSLHVTYQKEKKTINKNNL